MLKTEGSTSGLHAVYLTRRALFRRLAARRTSAKYPAWLRRVRNSWYCELPERHHWRPCAAIFGVHGLHVEFLSRPALLTASLYGRATSVVCLLTTAPLCTRREWCHWMCGYCLIRHSTFPCRKVVATGSSATIGHPPTLSFSLSLAWLRPVVPRPYRVLVKYHS